MSTGNDQPTNGSSNMLEKNINHTKGPPPPVAPKPSWARQTNTAIATTAVAGAPTKTSSSTYSPSNNENDKSNNNISPSNVNVTERHPSQKFNRSSSMNQISTNLPPPLETPPARNKSLSVPDSRLNQILVLKFPSFFSFEQISKRCSYRCISSRQCPGSRSFRQGKFFLFDFHCSKTQTTLSRLFSRNIFLVEEIITL